MSHYSLDVKNYQIIKQAHLEFHQGLTLITGKSNNGKSSLFKAFKQLAYNTPGMDFIKHNTKQSTITLTHQDTTITYSKHISDGGKYHIQTPQINEVYTKLGSSQPDIVKETLRIDKEFNYNFWDQLNKPFLISMSPREQFDLIQNSPHSITLNQCISNITADRKQSQTQQVQLQSQLDLLHDQISQQEQQITNLPKLATLHQQITTLQNTSLHLNNLTDLLDAHNSIDISTIQAKLSKLGTLPTLTSLETTLNQFTNIDSIYQLLLGTTKPINDIQHQITTKSTTYDAVSKLLTEQFTSCPLCNQPFTTQGGV